MTNRSQTRRVLIDEGLKALLRSGYDGVGLGAILEAAGVPKGSFYHFFSSKEDFAFAVLESYEHRYVELRQAILGDVSTSPFQRLKTYFDELERIHAAEPLDGCLFGVLSQTAAVRSPAFRKRLAAIFATWEKQMGQLLAEAQAAGEVDRGIDAATAAAFLIEAYEGALLRMKVDGSAAAFARFKTLALGGLRSR